MLAEFSRVITQLDGWVSIAGYLYKGFFSIRVTYIPIIVDYEQNWSNMLA